MSDQTIGPYRVLGKLGEGGMGEVYRAHDSKLHRDVAVKVLPDSLAADPERVARFEREAQVLAALNHPNIAAIYGVEGGDGAEPRALVMELVEGPTLAELLIRAGAPDHGLPVSDALAIARQIIDALEAAHERGIVHRDLKPANIKVRDDGTVKVLDFGLAKALDPSGGSDQTDPMNSPTLTARSTQLGVILGTAAYMSPEQAKGRPVDKRADIWAFGAVLYEMLSGRRAFAGEDVSDTLASVLRQDVDWQALPPETPPEVRHLLGRCLERDVKRRLRDIGDARADLDNRVAVPVAVGASASLPSPLRRLATRLLPWAAGLVIAAAGVSWGLLPTPRRAAGVVTRTEIKELDLELFLRLSHDGTRLTYSIVKGQGSAVIGMRLMSEFAGKPVSGADGAFSFFSPDAQWIAYQSLGQDGKIRKIPASGGTPITLCDGDLALGGDWGPDGSIVFATPQGLRLVSGGGGTPETLTTVDAAKGETSHSYPRFLPGGKRVLFTVTTKSGAEQFAVLDLATRTYQTVAPGGNNGQYQPSGHLTFVRGTTLFAVPFDVSRLVVTGPEMPVVEGVSTGADGVADYTVSDDGLLIYGNQTGGGGTTLAWTDRKGTVTPLPGPSRAKWGTGRLSPDGRQVANTMTDSSGADDVWVFDTVRGTTTRLSNVGNTLTPIWSPDGRRLIFASIHDNHTVFYTVPADNSGAPSVLARVDSAAEPTAISPDGRTALFLAADADKRNRLMALPIGPTGSTGPARPWHETSSNDGHADFSPNGQWVAYESAQSGGLDIYVQAASGTGPRVRVSPQGGHSPRWSRNGRELFYWVNTPASRLMSVDVTPGAIFNPGVPHAVIDMLSGTTWDVTADPNRFLVELTTSTGASSLVMVTDWFDEVRRLAPPRT